MFGQIEEMQKQMQEKLSSILIKSETGGVTVEVNAAKEIQNISINPELLQSDVEELEDLLLVTMNKAMAEAEEKAAAETQSMMSNIIPPGMSGLFG